MGVNFLKIIAGIFLIGFILYESAVVLFNINLFDESKKHPIKVGIVYSLTGFRAIKEIPIKEATLLAIEEINQKGGILGRRVIPVIRDAQSTWSTTRDVILNLIDEEKVAVIFGCWVQDDYSPLKEIYESRNHLLFDPFQHSFVESSNIVFLGISANQQVMPTVPFCLNKIGKRFFLVGSNYLYTYSVNKLLKEQLEALGGDVLGEFYLNTGGSNIDQVIHAIIKAKPDVIINSISGEDIEIFFKKLREAGIQSSQIPTFSFTVTEQSLKDVPIENFVGDYGTWNYFESIDTEENRIFKNKMLTSSSIQALDNSLEAGYLCVHLWAKAALESGETSAHAIKTVLRDMYIEAPEGPVVMGMDGNNAWKHVRIGQIQANRQYKIIWDSIQPIRPVPYLLNELQGLKKRDGEEFFSK